MTEADWLAATDPMPMLAFLEGKASDRKLRLFAVACCRRIPIIDSHDHGVAALDLAERLAEGRATNAERRQMRVSLMNPRPWIAVLLDILDHCRGPGPHVRGCWVVDLLLGKE